MQIMRNFQNLACRHIRFWHFEYIAKAISNQILKKNIIIGDSGSNKMEIIGIFKIQDGGQPQCLI